MQPLVLADVTRPEPLQDQPVHGKQNIIVRIFSDWLRPGLNPVFARPLQTGLWDDDEVSGPVGTPFQHFPVPEIYELQGLKPSFDGWVKLFCARPTADVLELLAPYFKNRFVIGFELSPYLLQVLDALQVPYVSFAVHPIRFLPDYLFQIDSNFLSPSAIEDFRVTGEQIAFEATIFRNAQSYRGCSGLGEDAAIIFGQEEYDASLIADGKVSRLEDYVQDLAELSAAHEVVYFKPHPYARHIAEQITFMRQFANVRTINGNPYKLLADPAIKTVVAQSSSVLTEAQLFGKEIKALWPKWTSKADTPAYRVDALSEGFWRRAVDPAGSGSPVVAYDPARAGLKRLLGFSWSDHGQDPEMNPKEPIPVGSTVHFGHQDLAGIVLQPGDWYLPETDHCWTRPGRSPFTVKLPLDLEAPIRFEVTYAAMANEEHPVTCDIRTGDLLLSRRRFTHTDPETDRIDVPMEALNAMGEVTLELVCIESNSPLVISGSPDQRLMSVLVLNLKVCVAGEDDKIPAKAGPDHPEHSGPD